MSFLRNIVCCLLLAAGFTSVAQQKEYSFANIDIQQGLSGNQVNSVFKDSKGFMWFGTLSGLNRYDGYHFRVFRHEDGDTATLLDDNIVRVFEGPHQKLWIQSQSNFSIYDQLTEKITRNAAGYFQWAGLPADGFLSILRYNDAWYFIYANAGIYEYREGGKVRHLKQSVLQNHSTNPITGAGLDSKGYCWLVRYNGMIEKIDLEQDRQLLHTDLFTRQDIRPQTGFSYAMVIDSHDDIWLFQRGTLAGIYRYQTSLNQIKRYHTGSVPALSNNSINCVSEDGHGQIWIGTDHGGLNIFDKNTESITVLLNTPNQHKSIADEAINAVYRDDQGIMWLATNKKGINYFDERTTQFPLYSQTANGSRNIPFSDVNAFVEDDKGNWWIGTNGGGLIYYDRSRQTYTTYRHQPGNENSLTNDVVVSLLIDRNNKLWIGTYLGGMDCYDGNTFRHFKHNPDDPQSIADDRVFSLYEDRSGNLWVGTNNYGLDRYDRGKNMFYHHMPSIPQSLHSPNVTSITEDARGNLWVGTAWGIDVLDKGSGRFIHYLKENSKLSYNTVNDILEDHAGNIWVATNSGLNVMPKGKNSFISFYVRDGLANNTVLDMLEDDQHYIWVSSKSGVTRIEVVADKGKNWSIRCINYNEFDGLQGREFNRLAAMKTRKGELVFGGANGFNAFHPASIRNDHQVPPLVLTGFSLFNQPLVAGARYNGRAVLEGSIGTVKGLRLKHNENDFSFQFAALEFIQTNKIRYAYQLEGFNKDWIFTDGHNRQATYTNIDPGTYTFLVKATNEDGTWNEAGMIRLPITVLSPWWQTPVAYIAYALLVATLLYLGRAAIIKREKLNYQITAEREQARRLHELDLMKIRFFTNVSHEFKTPLSLILTPIEKMIGQTKDALAREQLQLIQRNARRLLNMVNQLLDFRKMEVNELRLHTSQSDIVHFLRELSYAFSDLADKKHIHFSFRSAVDELTMAFDHDKMERILFNLLSNAFKFTPESGTVEVKLAAYTQDDTAWFELMVKDSGIGIDPEKQGRIFDRFFQASLPGNVLNQGSGIGLSITREFVEMHGGKITVQSQPGLGSSFKVLLPVAQGLAPEQVVIEQPAVKLPRKQPVILLVEDNDDFRFYLKENLRGYFTLLEAVNGKEGWKKALAEHPDLVVSDISMPVMDGLELCRKIKTDDRTRHLPVILLTALADEQQQLQALETGPNDYLTKPFNFEILLSKIKNLIRYQEQVKQTYQKQVSLAPSEIEEDMPESDFIRKVLAVIEANMANADFSVDHLRQELLLSRTSMYKKLLHITGKTPIEFIRSIRLQRAAQLLEKSSHM